MCVPALFQSLLMPNSIPRCTPHLPAPSQPIHPHTTIKPPFRHSFHARRFPPILAVPALRTSMCARRQVSTDTPAAVRC